MHTLVRGYRNINRSIIMKTEKNTIEIRVQAIKIAKEKQKVLKQSGVPVTAAVKAELMKAAIAEARKSTKIFPWWKVKSK